MIIRRFHDCAMTSLTAFSGSAAFFLCTMLTCAPIDIAQAQSAQSPSNPAQATPQPSTVERQAAGPSGQDIRVGVFVNVGADCSSGPLPTIRLVTPPSRGKVDVKSAKVKATNYKQCLALEVPAYVASYRSEASFRGVDSFAIEVRYAGGRTQRQLFKVTVGDPAPKLPLKQSI